MELKLLEATGINKNNILLMNDSEYAYICGSLLIVRFFDFKGIKEIRTLRFCYINIIELKNLDSQLWIITISTIF